GGNREALERLARYILRPPLAQSRLERGPQGSIVLHMKKAWRNGTSAVALEPLDFMAKLAALVPRPRQNTLRFHGLYAPNARLRSRVVVPPEQTGRAPCSCGPKVPST
ncbi:MAG: transposase, partial [Candidatus Wallbacteria bacterium]|nr:transposase [Candidatus Wallbacteria bacterium]